MGLLERIGRVFRANVGSLVDRAEDPEKVLEQTVLEMQENLIEMRQAVAGAIATQKRTERQMGQNRETAEQWRSRAQLALEKGNEDLAREALTKGRSYQQSAETLKAQIDQQRELVDRLKKDMRTLEAKISEAKTKKDLFIARARSAAASQKIRDLSDSVNTGGSLNAFERMEDKVWELEAQSEATEALETDDLEKKFAALEGADNQGKLPSSQNSEEIDQELEKLRSDLDRL